MRDQQYFEQQISGLLGPPDQMATEREQEVAHDAADACSVSFVSETSQSSDDSGSPLLQSFSLKKLLQDDNFSTTKSSLLTAESPVIPIQLFDGDLSHRRTSNLHHETEENGGRKLMESYYQYGEASSQSLVTSAANDDDNVDNDTNAGDQDSSTSKELFSQSTAGAQQLLGSFPQREEEAEVTTDTGGKPCNQLSATSSCSDSTKCGILGAQTVMEERTASPGLTYDRFQASSQKANEDYNIEHGGNKPQNGRHGSCGIENSPSNAGSSLTTSGKQVASKDVGDTNEDHNVKHYSNKSPISHHECGGKKSSSSSPGSSCAGSSMYVVDTNNDHNGKHGSDTFQNSHHENTCMEISPSSPNQKGHTRKTIRPHPQTEGDVEDSPSLDSSPKSQTLKTLGNDRNVCPLTMNSCLRVKHSVKKFKVPYNTSQNESVLSDAVQSSITMEREGVQNEQCLINSGNTAIQKNNTQENNHVRSCEPLTLRQDEENARISPVDGNMEGDARVCAETLTIITESVRYSHVTGAMKDSVREKNPVKGSEPKKKNDEPVHSQIIRETTDASPKDTYTLCNKGSDIHSHCVVQETESEMSQEVYACTQAARHIQPTDNLGNDGVTTQDFDSFRNAKETTPNHDCVRSRGLVSQHGDVTRQSSKQKMERIDYSDNGCDRDDESDVTLPPHSVYSKEKPSSSEGCVSEGAKGDSWKSQNIVDTAKDIDYMLSKDLNQAGEILIMERVSHVYGKRSILALEKTAKAFVIQCLEKAILLINKRQQQEKSILAMKVDRGKMTQREKSDTKKRLQNLSERCVTLRNLFHDHQKWKMRVSACVTGKESSQSSAIDVTQRESLTAHTESAKSCARKDTGQFHTIRNSTLQKNGDPSTAYKNDTSKDFVVSSSKETSDNSCAINTISDDDEIMDNGGEVMHEGMDDDQMSQSILLPRSLQKQRIKTPLSQAFSIYPNVADSNMQRQTPISKSVSETQNLHPNRESLQASEISTTIHNQVSDLNRSSITTVVPKSQNAQYIKQRPKTVTPTNRPGQLNESPDTNASTQGPENSHGELMDTESQSVLLMHDTEKTAHLAASSQQEVSEDYQNVHVVSSVPTRHCISYRIQHSDQQDVEHNRSALVYQDDILMSQTTEPLSQTAHDSELLSQSILRMHTVSSKMSHGRDDSRLNYNGPETADDSTMKGSENDDVLSDVSVNSTRREKSDIRNRNTKDQNSAKGTGIKTTITNVCKPRKVQSPNCSTFSRKRLRSSSSPGMNSEAIHSLQNDNDVENPNCKLQKMDSTIDNKRQNIPSSIAQPNQNHISGVRRERITSCTQLTLNNDATPTSDCTELLALETSQAITEVLPSNGINTRSLDCAKVNFVAENTNRNAFEEQRQTTATYVSSASQNVTGDKQPVTVNIDIHSDEVRTTPRPLQQSKSAEQRTSGRTPSFSQNVGSKQAMSTFNQPASIKAPFKLLNMNSPKQPQKFSSEPLQTKETIILSPESQQSRVSHPNPTRGPFPRFTTPRRPASPSASTATSMTDVFPVSSKEIVRRMAKETTTGQNYSISEQTECSSKQKETQNKQLGPISSQISCNPRHVLSSGGTDHRERTPDLEDRQLRDGQVTDNAADVCCSDVASIGSGATNMATQTPLVRQKSVNVLQSGAAVATGKVSRLENYGLNTLASTNRRKPKLPRYSDMFASGVVQPGTFSLSFPWNQSLLAIEGFNFPRENNGITTNRGVGKRGTILADGRIKDSAGLTFTNPVSWYKAVTGMPKTTKITAYSKIFYKGRPLAAVCNHFKVWERHTLSEAGAPPPSKNTATAIPSAATPTCPPPKVAPSLAPLERPRARVTEAPSYEACNNSNREKNPSDSAGGFSRRKLVDNTGGSEEQSLPRSVSVSLPNRAASSPVSSPSTARVLASLRRLKLIKDEEIVPHNSECEFISFWDTDFAKITVSQGFWATVDDWD